jgi:hypothetical protein
MELALIGNDRHGLYIANETAREHIKTLKNRRLVAHWQQLISQMEQVLNCADDVA